MNGVPSGTRSRDVQGSWLQGKKEVLVLKVRSGPRPKVHQVRGTSKYMREPRLKGIIGAFYSRGGLIAAPASEKHSSVGSGLLQQLRSVLVKTMKVLSSEGFGVSLALLFCCKGKLELKGFS